MRISDGSSDVCSSDLLSTAGKKPGSQSSGRHADACPHTHVVQTGANASVQLLRPVEQAEAGPDFEQQGVFFEKSDIGRVLQQAQGDLLQIILPGLSLVDSQCNVRSQSQCGPGSHAQHG